jgi:hypothetical protein
VDRSIASETGLYKLRNYPQGGPTLWRKVNFIGFTASPEKASPFSARLQVASICLRNASLLMLADLASHHLRIGFAFLAIDGRLPIASVFDFFESCGRTAK